MGPVSALAAAGNMCNWLQCNVQVLGGGYGLEAAVHCHCLNGGATSIGVSQSERAKCKHCQFLAIGRDMRALQQRTAFNQNYVVKLH